MFPTLVIDNDANMGPGNAISLSKLLLEHFAGSIFLANLKDNISGEFALPILFPSVIKRGLNKVVSGVFFKGVALKIADAIVMPYAVLVMSGKMGTGWRKKGHDNDTVNKIRCVFPFLAKYTHGVSGTAWSVAQNTPVKPTTINSNARQTSHAAKRAGLIKTFVSRDWFPDFFRMHGSVSFRGHYNTWATFAQNAEI